MLLQTILPTNTMASNDMVMEIGVPLWTLVVASALVALEDVRLIFNLSKEEVLNILSGELHGEIVLLV